MFGGLTMCGVSELRQFYPKNPKELDKVTLTAQMNSFLGVVSSNRSRYMSKKRGAACFIRFIAPVQLGDEKQSDFVMPFKIDLF